jgi:diadenosine tetraphosphate (Ap4A) HIT family hydrolase
MGSGRVPGSQAALPFHADWMNYNFLGNDFHHLHGHLIPRYNPRRDVQFMGFPAFTCFSLFVSNPYIS